MTTQVKICGIKTADALDAALDGGADYVGLVFYEKSPRNISIADGAKLAVLARGKTKIVALLVDANDALVRDVCKDVAPDFLQLHGSESVERVREIRAVANRPILKAIGVSDGEDVKRAGEFFGPGILAEVILFDAKPPKGSSRTGGHGVAFDWNILSSVPAKMPWMLSGGLNPDNVAEAIRTTHAPAVDVSSGVESAPGVKDADLIRRFIAAAKTAKQSP